MLHLQQRGHDVVGIENSAGAVEVCRRRALEQAHLLPVRLLDDRFARFDTVLMLGGNVGLLANRDDGRRILNRLREITSNDRRILAASRAPHAGSDAERLEYMRRNREQGRLPGQFRIRIRYRRCKTPWFDYLRVSVEEMGALIEGTGWRIESVLREDESLYIAVLS
jgi:hypothetical protein